MRTYKLRLYPTPAQETLFQQSLDGCRFVHNWALEAKRKHYLKKRKNLSYIDLQNELPKLKKKYFFLTKEYARCLQQSIRRVDRAFQDFFRRIKAGEKPGFPRFKSKENYKSFCYPQINKNHTALLGIGFIKLPKIGLVKARGYKWIRGNPKTLVVKKDSLDRWWTTIVVEEAPEPLPKNNRKIGIDLGVKTFLSIFDGKRNWDIPNPKFFMIYDKAIRKTQEMLSKAKNKKKRDKLKRKLNHQWDRVNNLKENFVHQKTRELINAYGSIYIEDLDVKGMLKKNNPKKNLRRHLRLTALGQFIRILTYKAEWAGRQLVKVEARGTTQSCSECGTVVPKELDDRWHHCKVCGLSIDRDHNAARNIFRLGSQSVKAL